MTEKEKLEVLETEQKEKEEYEFEIQQKKVKNTYKLAGITYRRVEAGL